MGGKGGVGKTTCAAIQALGSHAGRTLLVTTDPASSLADALQIGVAGEPRPVPGVPGLFAANVEAARAFARWIEPRRALVAAIAVRGTYLDDEDVARLLTLSLPGVDEVIGLVEVVRLAAGFDAVVVDTAPTGHTLRLLAAPALLGRVSALFDGLQAHHRTVVSALRGSYRADAADALIADLQREGELLAALLRDADTTIEWVTLPEPMALEETADAVAALAAAGIRVRRLIVNRLTPPSREPCAWCDARRRFEARALAPLSRRFPESEIVTYPEIDREPTGVRALKALASRQSPWLPPGPVPPLPRRVRATLPRQKGDSPLFHPMEKGTAPFFETRPRVDQRSARSTNSGLLSLRPAADVRPPTEKGDSPLFRALEKGTAPFFRMSIRWLLFAGKGGVGKSTCAAATAVRLAETRRVLLVSTDPAHSLGDVFGQRFDNTPRQVQGLPRLDVREIDAGHEMDRLRQRYVDAVDDAFARLARAGAGEQNAFREIIDLAPPGIDEIIAIADLAEAIADGTGGYDVIVTDTAPTGHALRLLETPAVLREWTQALMTILLKYREVVGAGSLAALLVQLSKRLRGLQQVLGDPARAQVVVVTRPEALPATETRHLVAALDRLGIAVAGVLVNAAGRGTCRSCRAIAAAQAVEIARLPYAIIVSPAEVPPPHGLAALRTWLDSWQRRRS